MDFQQPRRGNVCGVSVSMGILTAQKWIPDSDRVSRGSDAGGFGWIPIPWNWNPPTQQHTTMIQSGPAATRGEKLNVRRLVGVIRRVSMGILVHYEQTVRPCRHPW